MNDIVKKNCFLHAVLGVLELTEASVDHGDFITKINELKELIQVDFSGFDWQHEDNAILYKTLMKIWIKTLQLKQNTKLMEVYVNKLHFIVPGPKLLLGVLPYISVDILAFCQRYGDFVSLYQQEEVDFLSSCVMSERLDIALFILNFCKPKQKDVDNAFVRSCVKNQKQLAEFFYLYLNDSDINTAVCNQYGSTALMHAAQHGNEDMVKWLFSLGADVSVVNNNSGKRAILYVLLHYKGESVGSRKRMIDILEEAEQKQSQIKKQEKEAECVIKCNNILNDNISTEKKFLRLKICLLNAENAE